MTVLAQTHAQQVRQMDDPESQGSALESISGMPAWPTAFRHGLHVAAAEHCQLCERCMWATRLYVISARASDGTPIADASRTPRVASSADSTRMAGVSEALRVVCASPLSPSRKHVTSPRGVLARRICWIFDMCGPVSVLRSFADSERTRNLIDVQMDVMAG